MVKESRANAFILIYIINWKHRLVPGQHRVGENPLGFFERLFEVEFGITGAVVDKGEFFDASCLTSDMGRFLGGHVFFAVGILGEFTLEHPLADKKVGACNLWRNPRKGKGVGNKRKFSARAGWAKDFIGEYITAIGGLNRFAVL
jgi:hypothetical protein